MSEPACRSARRNGGARRGLLRARWRCRWCIVGATGLSAQAHAARTAGASGLPVPRFVSLKSDRVNLRQGPGTEYPTAWVFRRAGLPVEVIKEFESWRQVRDAEGTTGWVPGLDAERPPHRRDPALGGEGGPDASRRWRRCATTTARAPRRGPGRGRRARQHHQLRRKWCRVSVGGFRGYIEQSKLWGAYRMRSSSDATLVNRCRGAARSAAISAPAARPRRCGRS